MLVLSHFLPMLKLMLELELWDEYRGYKEEQKKAKVEAEDALKKAKETIKLNSLKTKFKNL